MRGDGLRRVDCDRPLLVVCRDGCQVSTTMRCGNHRASKCGPCSESYRRRVTRVVAEGLVARRPHAGGRTYLLTLTAPPEDAHEAWVPGWDRRTARPVCECHEAAVGGLGLWNAGASSRWNVLRGALRRLAPGLEFFRAVEVQKRGALHLHIPLWSPVPLVVHEVQRLAVRAGFGCVIDLAEVTDPERAARYVAKYVTKATDGRDEAPWDEVNEVTGEVRPLAEAPYRTWSSSRGWGMTMKVVREAIRQAAARRAAAIAEPGALVGVAVPASEPKGPD